MKFKTILLILLVVIAIAMIGISLSAGILAPALTGVGFIIIARLFHQNT